MNDEFANPFLFVVGVLIGGCLGSCAAIECNDAYWQTECIERGYAEYDAVTGEWEWKDNKPKQEND